MQPVNDPPQQRRVGGQIVLLQNRLGWAFLAVMPEFGTFNVERNGALNMGNSHDLIRWNEYELRVAIDELPD
jgi:hypothetical protein